MIVRRSADNGNTWGPNITAANDSTSGSDIEIYPIPIPATSDVRTSGSDPELLAHRSIRLQVTSPAES